MSISALFRLIALVFVAVTCIVIGDTAGKLMTAQGVEPVLVAWSRFVIGFLVILPFSGLKMVELAALKDWRVLLRGVVIAGGIACILTALKTEPIANVFGAFFVGPIVSYALAVWFLGETPTGRRTFLLAVGFLGVLLVVKPGFGATAGMGFALGAGCFYGIYLAMTRLVASRFRPRFLLVSQLLVGTIVLAPLGTAVTFPPLTTGIGALVLVSALGSALGNFLLVIANRTAEASLIAPLVYTQLISATVLGVFVFGDWPDLFALIGLCLILVSGLGSLFANRSIGA